jgi:hypothetical protein
MLKRKYKAYATKIILFYFFFHLFQVSLTKDIPKKLDDLNCKKNEFYKNLEITTNRDENSDNFDVVVMKNCEIDEMWKVKEDYDQACRIPQRVFEGEDNIRRAFRFSYISTDDKDEKIQISSIKISYPRNIAMSRLSTNTTILSPGESQDIYVDYDCLDMQSDKYLSENWFKIRFEIEFPEEEYKVFEYVKICNATYTDRLDFSHFIIIGLIALVIFASVKDYLKSKLELIIVERFTEIKNPENLLVISFVVGLMLIFLNVVNLFDKWVYLSIFIVGPLSIAMITEAIFRNTNIMLNLENKTFEIPYLGSITIFFLVCLSCGLFILFLWAQTHNWFINNLLSISISIMAIRLFKFTSFKFILAVYIMAFVFEYYWVVYNSAHYGENYKLTNNVRTSLPVKIICPEMTSSPFSACNSLPIADIILPGIFLSYSKKFDESKYIQHYFFVGSGALGIGLVINIIVYYYNMLPTPSFLFTGPLILLVTSIIAYKRQELYEFIEGFSSTAYENKLEKNLADFAEQTRRRGDSDANYKPPMMEMKETED